MASARNQAVLRQIRTLFDEGSAAALSDGQLLDRFAGQAGEPAEIAFAALIDRHGPRVLRACRASLGDPHDALDAFQATFLVLARRARSIRDRESVGGWLLGVAARVSANLRREAARRRRVERSAAEELGSRGPSGGGDRDELAELIREEVGRLPDRFREVVVLCDFEGRSCEEAADRLDCPVGTVKSRRSAARDRLRAGLVRRGLAPSASAISAAVAAEAIAAPPVPSILSKSTIEAATRFAAQRVAAASGEVPGAAATLAEEVLRAMIWTKTKYAVAAAGMLAVSAFAAVGQEPAAAPLEPAAAARLKEVEQKLDRVLRALERSAPAPPVEIGQDPEPATNPELPILPMPASRGFVYYGSTSYQDQIPPIEPPRPAEITQTATTVESRPGQPTRTPRIASVDENGWTEMVAETKMVPVYHLGRPPQAPAGPSIAPPAPPAAPGPGAPTTAPAPPHPPIEPFAPLPEKYRVTPGGSDPISALDRRISELEKRIDRLERRLDAGKATKPLDPPRPQAGPTELEPLLPPANPPQPTRASRDPLGPAPVPVAAPIPPERMLEPLPPADAPRPGT